MLQAGGLATLSGTRLRPTSRGRAVMAAPDYPVLGTLWGKWLTKAPIDEFSRIDAIKGQRKTATLTAATKRRSAVALGLADLLVGEWIEIDAVFHALQRRRELHHRSHCHRPRRMGPGSTTRSPLPRSPEPPG
ncbi:hypothetical protein [Catenulispora pinisilvae]|uniref:hypothetical protein n=1 Tax=Catenulispora pinisilvae TaxID=2705253 RepID=UPI0018920D0D|nr:hypothetical protein [Catenulispora pinisilvae]